MLTVYTKPSCPDCETIKSLLHTNGIEYKAVEVDEEVREKLIKAGVRAVPAVFDDELYMGGLKILRTAIKEGAFDV
jgi:glutaredoxin-like protein NrdH